MHVCVCVCVCVGVCVYECVYVCMCECVYVRASANIVIIYVCYWLLGLNLFLACQIAEEYLLSFEFIL